jgi:RNA polymerase sigma-70 factor (ECF subfamily)
MTTPERVDVPQAVTDALLVERALQDRRAFGALYERYADRLFRYALQRSATPEDADDVVSDTMLAALETLHRFDPARGSFAAWLFTIAARRAADQHRRRARFMRAITRRRADSGPLDETTEAVLRRDDYRLVRNGLAALSENDRELLLLRYAAELSGREIGEILNITEANVRVRLQRARQRLAEQLGDLV